MILYEDDDMEASVPVGWQDVTLTEDELDRMCDAAGRGELNIVERIVEGAYDRLYARLGTDILKGADD